MALQTSGAISLNDIHIEVGGTSGTTCSLNDADFRALINVGDQANQSVQLYYGKSSETSLPTSGSTVNGQVQLKQISASSYISSGGTLRIPSNMWVWSDSTSTAALTVDIPCTIINDGKIIGKGGTGGFGQYPASGYSGTGNGSGQNGGPAINVTSSGVTITNSSGAYICGGGGGGGSSGVEPQNTYAGGGGGAGGADGGAGGGVGTGNVGGTGGALNAAGGQHTGNPISSAPGGQAGGYGNGSGSEDQRSGGGGGGGRIVPGVIVSGVNSYFTAPGVAGNAGSNGGYGGNTGKAGGGGGWGASGGKGYRGTFVSHQCQGGSGGAAISGTSRTLSNSGTIYGGT